MPGRVKEEQMDVEAQIEKYAELVGQNGFYLDVTEAILFGEDDQKHLALALQNRDSEIEIISVYEHINHIVPALEIEGAHGMGDFDFSSPHTWLLLCVNALFEVEGPKNHYVPGFFREQLNQKEYLKLTQETWEAEEKKIAELQRALTKLEMEPKGKNSLVHISELKDKIKELLNIV